MAGNYIGAATEGHALENGRGKVRNGDGTPSNAIGGLQDGTCIAHGDQSASASGHGLKFVVALGATAKVAGPIRAIR